MFEIGQVYYDELETPYHIAGITETPIRSGAQTHLLFVSFAFVTEVSSTEWESFSELPIALHTHFPVGNEMLTLLLEKFVTESPVLEFVGSFDGLPTVPKRVNTTGLVNSDNTETIRTYRFIGRAELSTQFVRQCMNQV